jgi:cystathionine beta-lyase/cystathionine gamma-synthase
MNKKRDLSIDTMLVHTGDPEPRVLGAVSMPIFQSANYEHVQAASYHEIPYIRLNNTPNHLALHTKLAALESAESALATASGMAAITTTLLTILKNGDHLLAQDSLYGGTLDFIFHELEGFGISYDLIDGTAPHTWADLVKPSTRAIYVESMTNPLLQVPDLEAVVGLAREHGLVSVIDNTFATPVNFRPPELGFDLSLHSCTKYLNGHSDIVGGAVIGREDLVRRVTHKLNHLGGSLDPHACFLLYRSLKTLALRVRCQNTNALRIARFLDLHPAVALVNYPGLERHPGHARADRLFEGFGGMISFELAGGTDAAEAFFDRIQIPILAPSLGGVESLLTRPATTSHLGMDPDERRRIGISDSLVRFSVGIEAVDDLIEDLDQALGDVP